MSTTNIGESCYAYVRKHGQAWRDAEIEVVFIRYSAAIDRETIHDDNGSFTMRPKATLTIDGKPYCRFRLDDGRIAAVMEHMVRS